MSEQAVFDALKYYIEVDMRGTRWYYNSDNQFHREGGPAIEWHDGTKSWYQNGQRHRIDGPAIERNDGYREWWINGVYSWQNSSMHHTLVHFVQTHIR